MPIYTSNKLGIQIWSMRGKGVYTQREVKQLNFRQAANVSGQTFVLDMLDQLLVEEYVHGRLQSKTFIMFN